MSNLVKYNEDGSVDKVATIQAAEEYKKQLRSKAFIKARNRETGWFIFKIVFIIGAITTALIYFL